MKEYLCRTHDIYLDEYRFKHRRGRVFWVCGQHKCFHDSRGRYLPHVHFDRQGNVRDYKTKKVLARSEDMIW